MSKNENIMIFHFLFLNFFSEKRHEALSLFHGLVDDFSPR